MFLWSWCWIWVSGVWVTSFCVVGVLEMVSYGVLGLDFCRFLEYCCVNWCKKIQWFRGGSIFFKIWFMVFFLMSWKFYNRTLNVIYGMENCCQYKKKFRIEEGCWEWHLWSRIQWEHDSIEFCKVRLRCSDVDLFGLCECWKPSSSFCTVVSGLFNLLIFYLICKYL